MLHHVVLTHLDVFWRLVAGERVDGDFAVPDLPVLAPPVGVLLRVLQVGLRDPPDLHARRVVVEDLLPGHTCRQRETQPAADVRGFRACEDDGVSDGRVLNSTGQDQGRKTTGSKLTTWYSVSHVRRGVKICTHAE